MDTQEGAKWWIDFVLNQMFPPMLNRLLDDWESLCLDKKRVPSSLARANRVSGMLHRLADDDALWTCFEQDMKPQEAHALRHALRCLHGNPMAYVLLHDLKGFGRGRVLLPIVSSAIASSTEDASQWELSLFFENEYGYDD